MFKRIFDIVTALLGLIILSPFFVFIGMLIKRDTPGPVFYWGPRMGRKGRIFKILKFRTMYETADSYNGPRVTCQGDSRITPLGAWLRDTKINELPQLWNVLIGEMSWVGPRPEDPELAKNWSEEERSKILSIRPGITSPASILYHDEEKLLSNKNTLNDYYMSILPDKIRLDLLYVRHYSFFSDLDTLFWTAAVLIPRWAGTKIPEGYIFAGPISRIAHRYVSWFVIDSAKSLAIIGLAAIIWRTRLPLNWGVGYLAIMGIVLALLFSGLNSIAGLNRIVWSHATGEDIVGLLLSGSFVTGLSLALNYFRFTSRVFGLPALPTSMIIVIGLALTTMFIVTRYRLRLVSMIANRWLSLRRDALAMGDRVLVVGDGEAGQIATWLLGRQMFRSAFSIVGVINDNDPTKHGMRVNGNWMLGSLKDLPALIKKFDIGIILSAGPAATREANEYIFDLCQANNIRLFFLNDLMLMVDRQITQPQGSFEYPVWLDERLEFKAMHNAITGLPNRFLFQDRLKHSIAYAKRYKTQVAVLLVKINGMDAIIEKIGRKYGDMILMKTAERLSKCERESDTLAYVSENIFAVILQNISDASAAEIVANKMFASLAEPFTVEKLEFRLSADVKVYTGANGFDDLEALCKTEIKIAFTPTPKPEVLNWYDNAIDE